MIYRNLGRSGVRVSQLCLGCMTYGVPERGMHPWTLDEAHSRPMIRLAIEAGINFFDTANSYSDGTSEEIVGRALRDMAKRDEIVVATKCFYPWRPDRPNTRGLSRKAIFAALDDSLRRLGMEYIDLYQIHRWDPHTPIEETLAALDAVVESGKVRYLGASTMFAWQFYKALALAKENRWNRFISMQPQYSLLYREEEREMLPLCQAEGIGVIPWSPFGRGKLTRPWQAEPATDRERTDEYGKTLFGQTRDLDRPIIERLGEVAGRRGVPPAQVALAWVRRHPAITAPIIGVAQPRHLEDAVASLAIELKAEEASQLEEAYVPRRLAPM